MVDIRLAPYMCLNPAAPVATPANAAPADVAAPVSALTVTIPIVPLAGTWDDSPVGLACTPSSHHSPAPLLVGEMQSQAATEEVVVVV